MSTPASTPPVLIVGRGVLVGLAGQSGTHAGTWVRAGTCRVGAGPGTSVLDPERLG